MKKTIVSALLCASMVLGSTAVFAADDPYSRLQDPAADTVVTEAEIEHARGFINPVGSVAAGFIVNEKSLCVIVTE